MMVCGAALIANANFFISGSEPTKNGCLEGTDMVQLTERWPDAPHSPLWNADKARVFQRSRQWKRGLQSVADPPQREITDSECGLFVDLPAAGSLEARQFTGKAVRQTVSKGLTTT